MPNLSSAMDFLLSPSISQVDIFAFPNHNFVGAFSDISYHTPLPFS